MPGATRSLQAGQVAKQVDKMQTGPLEAYPVHMTINIFYSKASQKDVGVVSYFGHNRIKCDLL